MGPLRQSIVTRVLYGRMPPKRVSALGCAARLLSTDYSFGQFVIYRSATSSLDGRYRGAERARAEIPGSGKGIDNTAVEDRITAFRFRHS